MDRRRAAATHRSSSHDDTCKVVGISPELGGLGGLGQSRVQAEVKLDCQILNVIHYKMLAIPVVVVKWHNKKLLAFFKVRSS